jgi:hypothetical protein
MGNSMASHVSGSLETRSRRRYASARVLLAFATTTALAVFGVGTSNASGPAAVAARTLNLDERGHLHQTAHHGFKIDEQGSASGTIKGTIYIHLHITSTNRVTAEVNIYPHSGSLTGYATASYHSEGAVASFSGTMSVLRGTGSYAHARGSGLSFSGTIQRSNDAVSVRMSGRMSV